jgi:hypothetical protein
MVPRSIVRVVRHVADGDRWIRPGSRSQRAQPWLRIEQLRRREFRKLRIVEEFRRVVAQHFLVVRGVTFIAEYIIVIRFVFIVEPGESTQWQLQLWVFVIVLPGASGPALTEFGLLIKLCVVERTVARQRRNNRRAAQQRFEWFVELLDRSGVSLSAATIERGECWRSAAVPRLVECSEFKRHRF